MMMTEICAKLNLVVAPKAISLESLEDRILCKAFMENICASTAEDLILRRDYANTRWITALFQEKGPMTAEEIAEYDERMKMWRNCVMALHAHILDLANKW